MAQRWANNVRVHVVVRAERLTDAEQVAASIAGELGPPGFPTELNYSGLYADPATHYAASWQTDAVRKSLLPSVAQAAGFSVQESLLIKSGASVRENAAVWVFDGGSEPDEPGYWSWAMCLSALGLYVRGSVGPPPPED